jgi:hypothetical protein
MRALDELERLAAAAPAVEVPIDAGEEDRILRRILDSPRRTTTRRRPPAPVLAGVAVLAVAAAAASLELGNSRLPAPTTSGRHHVALTGAKLNLAGYQFRTPAGFKSSTSGCIPAPVPGQPQPAIDGFAAAAAADGACVEAADLVAGDWLKAHSPIPDAAAPIDVGSYHAFYVAPPAAGGESTLYVSLPDADPSRVVYLVLRARDVTEDELIAIAASGLPTLPSLGPTTTTGTETTG